MTEKSLHLAPALFYHLPVLFLKTGFLNPYPLSLGLCCQYENFEYFVENRQISM